MPKLGTQAKVLLQSKIKRYRSQLNDLEQWLDNGTSSFVIKQYINHFKKYLSFKNGELSGQQKRIMKKLKHVGLKM